MLFRSTIIASAALALVASVAEAHSWADCVDWRFNNPSKPGWNDKDGKCFGWARKFPLKENVRFGDLDSADPNRHYQQDPSDFTSCSDGKAGREPGADESRQNPVSKSYGGRYGAMASVKAGDMMCVRWPAKNHAVKDETDRGVFINMPNDITTKDPNQSTFMKMNIAKLPYKNCNHKSDTDHTPCGGCFKVPEDRKPGTYVVQWRWELNPNEWYTSCWDLAVTGKSLNPSNDTNFGQLDPSLVGDIEEGSGDGGDDSGDGDEEEDNGDDEEEDNGDDEEEDNGDDEDEDEGKDDEEDDEDEDKDNEDDEDDEDDEEEDNGDDEEEDNGDDEEEDNGDDEEEDNGDDEEEDNGDDEEDNGDDEEEDNGDDEEEDNGDDEEEDNGDDEEEDNGDEEEDNGDDEEEDNGDDEDKDEDDE